jgi:hypothetical protein
MVAITGVILTGASAALVTANYDKNMVVRTVCTATGSPRAGAGGGPADPGAARSRPQPGADLPAGVAATGRACRAESFRSWSVSMATPPNQSWRASRATTAFSPARSTAGPRKCGSPSDSYGSFASLLLPFRSLGTRWTVETPTSSAHGFADPKASVDWGADRLALIRPRRLIALLLFLPRFLARGRPALARSAMIARSHAAKGLTSSREPRGSTMSLAL